MLKRMKLSSFQISHQHPRIYTQQLHFQMKPELFLPSFARAAKISKNTQNILVKKKYYFFLGHILSSNSIICNPPLKQQHSNRSPYLNSIPIRLFFGSMIIPSKTGPSPTIISQKEEYR